ncbi:hypothetical protein GLAREA_04443 [Glarea lozoyensis ATCC 20868]|uniref:TLDc domain-containing protein n=1 Tax=Glarea lozoyensis (strain ATCC 20868 / MF5171) TaxID=1116229 RepID=S3CMA7_GLAL2|nr:uncharacterized protein GLAREA_04443 [Glarea lozoyensis ATCC 20868]EPE27652.1 hypothetical protein GLAREA_04443 [Glarea lozoyensis ATCC 20868]
MGFDPRIPKWEELGLLSPSSIASRLHKEIIGRCLKEDTRLRSQFLLYSVKKGNTQYWNESSLKNFLTVDSIENIAHHSNVVYSVIFLLLRYLSEFPFGTKLNTSDPGLITSEELLRAVFWLLPGKAERALGAGCLGAAVNVRARSAADQRRLLFEGLADVERDFAFNEAEEKKIASEKAKEVHEFREDFTLPNYDEEDERYHDILDVITYTQDEMQEERIGPCDRDDWRHIVSKLNKPTPLRRLAISRDRLKVLFEFGLVSHLTCLGEIEAAQIERSAESLLNTFCQSTSPHSVVTWQKFDDALTKKAASIFTSLYRAFDKLFHETGSYEANYDFLVYDQPMLSCDDLLSPVVLNQLTFVLATTPSFDTAPILYQTNASQRVSALGAITKLEDSLKTISRDYDFRMLLISGHKKLENETFIFGAFVKDLADSFTVVELEDKRRERTFLFQVSPTHDVFRSQVGKTAFAADDGLSFGTSGSGFSMRLESDLSKLHVCHKLAGDGVYQPTTWRGDWELELEVDRIELRGD